MAEIVLARIRNLERENRELRQELALTIAERGEEPADGPSPEMFKEKGEDEW